MKLILNHAGLQELTSCDSNVSFDKYTTWISLSKIDQRTGVFFNYESKSPIPY